MGACRKPRKGAVTRSNSYDDESYLNGIITVHERMVQLRYNLYGRGSSGWTRLFWQIQRSLNQGHLSHC